MRRSWIALLLCLALLLSFFGIAWNSARQQSATVDEPLHALSAYRAAFEGDFRMDADNPPLWKYWAMLPNAGVTLRPYPNDSGTDPASGGFIIATQVLSQTPGNDGMALIQRSRIMMLILGTTLGVVIACWSWRIAGPIAAVVSVGFFAFDPNLLAHAPLVKNDVALALIYVAIAWTTWEAGRRLNALTLLSLLPLLGIAMTIKVSGPVAGGMMGILLLIRALIPSTWLTQFGEVHLRWIRLGGATGIGVLSLLIAWSIIWACYGFRFEPSPNRKELLDLQAVSHTMQRGSTDLPLSARTILWMNDHRLLPQAWLAGTLGVYAATLARPSYLMGEISMTGWWSYFPVAMLTKTPLATLAALALGIFSTVAIRRRQKFVAHDSWTFLCLLIPPLLYAALAMQSSFNLGIRHILPVYPFLYIGLGVAAVNALAIFPHVIRLLLPVLALALISDVVVASPHFISYFNFVARPHRLWLLSDSNFDWGQDLPAVAAWQKDNPDTPLYLAYWGPLDPRSLGIRYINLPGGFGLGHNDPPLEMSRPGVVMVSATILQGVNFPPDIRDFYAPLRQREPDSIIGDTIYLYRWNP